VLKVGRQLYSRKEIPLHEYPRLSLDFLLSTSIVFNVSSVSLILLPQKNIMANKNQTTVSMYPYVKADTAFLKVCKVI